MNKLNLILLCTILSGCATFNSDTGWPAEAYSGSPTKQIMSKITDDLLRMYPGDGYSLDPFDLAVGRWTGRYYYRTGYSDQYGLGYMGWGVGHCELITNIGIKRLVNARNQGQFEGQIFYLLFLTPYTADVDGQTKYVGHTVAQVVTETETLCMDNGAYFRQPGKCDRAFTEMKLAHFEEH